MNKLNEKEWTLLRATIGRFKKVRHLSVLEVVELLVKANSYLSSKEISKNVGRSKDIIEQFLKINNIKENKILNATSWQGNLSNREISMTTASFIGGVDDKVNQIKLFEGVIKHKLTKSDVYEVRSHWKKNARGDISKSIEEVLSYKPKVVSQEVILGALKSKTLQKILSKRTNIEKNKLLNSILKDQFSHIVYKGAVLKNDKFMIIGDNETLKQINKLNISLEETIENKLKIITNA